MEPTEGIQDAVFTCWRLAGNCDSLIVTPNGGDSWRVRTHETIPWSGVGFTGNVKIDLSRNAGATWTTLFSSTPNDGQQAWRVSGKATTQGRIRVCSVNTPSLCDVRNADFTIPRP